MAIFFLPTISSATHIVGGELNYRYIGNNQYIIHLTMYRDCYNGVPPFDNPASLGIFDMFDNLVVEIPLDFPGSDTIPPTINSPCFVPPTNICYEHTTYIDTITLPPSPQGYQLAYQRCCRNVTILNIIQPNETGATFYATIPGTVLFFQNSNPVFKNWPPPFICAGIPFVFDHSATDFDGDSIVYELCTPLMGADTMNPEPQPPNPPPYDTVIYQFPYSLNNMLGGAPLTIDPHTGILTCTPVTIGQFVIGVCAEEFRNGVYLGKTKRDFQLNVVPCPSYVVAAIQDPIINCKTHQVTFQNLSINAGSYLWNFGDPGTLADSSHLTTPNYIYPDTGVYHVTLIAYSFQNPNCADTTVGDVTILPEYTPGFLYQRDVCTNKFNFTDTSNTVSGTTFSWDWDFGDGSTSSIHNPQHLYTTPGNYTVTLIATSSRGCVDTFSVSINVPALLTATNPQIKNVNCYGECNGTALVTGLNGNPPYNYQWSDPLSQTTAFADSLCKGNYIVTVTDSLGCSLTKSITITQPDSLHLTIIPTVDYCSGACIGTATALISGGSGGYIFNWSDSLHQQTVTATQLCNGSYSVLITDQNGCSISASTIIIYSDSVPALNVTADATILYQGQSTFLHAHPNGNVYTYNWTPAATLDNPSSANPKATPVDTTTYFVTMTDVNGCSNTDSITIILNPVTCREPELFIPNAFSPNDDQQNDILFVKGNTIETMHIAIYDRWGEKVFETNDKNIGWDGTFKGAKVAPAVYVYYLDIGCYNKEKFSKKGNITVIR